MYNEKFVVIDIFIEYFDKNIYFRNVNYFINKTKNIIEIKKTKIIRQNFYICFKNVTTFD